MEQEASRKGTASLAYAALLGLALANGGCLLAAAGVAGGAAAGYAYYKGKITQEYNAGFEDTWAAANSALADLGMPVVAAEREGNTGFLDGRSADGERVRLSFETFPSPLPAEGALTRVGVRVATFGDGPASDRILNQIEAQLAARPRTMTPVPSSILGPIESVPGPGAAPAVAPTAQPVTPAGFGPQTVEPPLLPAKKEG